MQGPQLSTEIDTAAVREADVEYRDVDPGEVQLERFVQRPGLGHDLQVLLGFEQFAKSAANDFVVVNEQ
jgi:hypothetical protein